MLLELQRRFRDGLLADNPDTMAGLIAGSQAGFGVHRANVAVSLTEALASAFPVVRRLVGPDFFRTAADRFLRRHPPAAPRLSAYGAAFPAFLAGFAPAAALPYLPDVARLEWARMDSYFGPGGDRRIDPAALASLPPHALPDLRLRPHPSLRLLSSPHPIATIWALNQPQHEAVPPIDLARPEAARVLCMDGHVRIQALAPGDFAFLDALARDEALATAAEEGAAADPGFDLAAALRDALGDGAFVTLLAGSEATA